MMQLDDISLVRRALAYWWYAWGLSWCYWGIRTAEPACRTWLPSADRSAAWSRCVAV